MLITKMKPDIPLLLHHHPLGCLLHLSTEKSLGIHHFLKKRKTMIK
jgi:hypothetical protein